MLSNFKEYSKRPTKKQEDKISICVFYKDRVPFDLRLITVFNLISNDSKYEFYIVYPKDYDKFKKDISNNLVNFDYIILQRDYFDFEIAEILIDKSNSLNFNIIYEIDDDLIHMDESNPGYTYYMEIKDKLEYFISNANIVTVTTQNLKNQLSNLNDNIRVIPNRLVDEWFENDYNKFIKPNNIIKIGYMGSIYHSWDLVLIQNAINNVKEYFLKKNISIIFEIIGGTTDVLNFASQIEVPSDKENYFNFIKWYKNIVDWDIALAPLEYSNINLSKSELKYLEYSVLGIPGIYSDMGPYSQKINHEENGLLVFSNSSEEWEKAIIRLIENVSLRKKIIQNSCKDVISNYLISDSVVDWLNIFENNVDHNNIPKSVFTSDLVKKEIFSYYPINNDNEKILLVGHSGKNGGAEILLKNLIVEFKNQDVDVVVFVKEDGPIIDEYRKLAPTFIIDSKKKMEDYSLILTKFGFENAILNTVVTGNFIHSLKKNNFYIISLVHELPGVIKGLGMENMSKIIADFADLVVFPSIFVADKFEEMFKIKNKKLIQPQGFYNAYNKFDKVKSRQILEEKHNIPKDNQIILNVGRGEPRKGFDIFLEVSQKLQNENITFIWVGYINQDLEEKYSNEINESPNLILTGFISDKKEIMVYYDACDIFLLTSREDPFPSVVFEAFNAKKPVIGFKNAGGFQDIVINDVSGYLVKYESVDELVAKINILTNNEELREDLGKNSKKICNHYKFDKYIEFLKLTAIHGKIIKRNNYILSLENEISSLKKRNQVLHNEKNQILSSTSWKMTEPLRKIKHIFNTK